ncbi:TlpA family protein disulfide reductase [Oceanithermus sp.]
MKRLGVLSVFLLAAALATGGAPSYHPPTQAIAFYGPLLGGGTMSFSDYLGKTPVILNFWASWGSPSGQEAELLEEVYRDYAGKLLVVGVNVQDPEENARAFVAEHKISYPMVLDGTADVAWIYRVKYLPTTFFISASGKIIAIHRGPLSKSQLNHYLKLLLETQVSGDN